MIVNENPLILLILLILMNEYLIQAKFDFRPRVLFLEQCGQSSNEAFDEESISALLAVGRDQRRSNDWLSSPIFSQGHRNVFEIFEYLR